LCVLEFSIRPHTKSFDILIFFNDNSQKFLIKVSNEKSKDKKTWQMYLTRIFTIVFLEFGRGTFETNILLEKWVRFFRLSKCQTFSIESCWNRLCLYWKNVSKYWRNNLVESGPSLSGFLDKFAFFPRLVCQANVFSHLLRRGKIPSITWESNPAPLGLQTTKLTTTPFKPLKKCALTKSGFA
jgi:hypothetical protein